MNYELKSTSIFDKWFSRIKDRAVRNKILARLSRIENGNFGDFKQIASSLFELRFFFGGGIRIYYTVRGTTIVLLLSGGTKTTQTSDVKRAKAMLDELEES